MRRCLQQEYAKCVLARARLLPDPQERRLSTVLPVRLWMRCGRCSCEWDVKSVFIIRAVAFRECLICFMPVQTLASCLPVFAALVFSRAHVPCWSLVSAGPRCYLRGAHGYVESVGVWKDAEIFRKVTCILVSRHQSSSGDRLFSGGLAETRVCFKKRTFVHSLCRMASVAYRYESPMVGEAGAMGL